MSDLYTLKRIIRNQAETQCELNRLDIERATIYKQLQDIDNIIDLTYRKREDYHRELKQWEDKYCIQLIDNDTWQSEDR